MKKWLLIGIFMGAVAHGNSFVGNGGSEGDVEWLVTLRQIQETFRVIVKNAEGGEPLCRCNKMYQGRAVCGLLEALEPAQSEFCSKTLYKQADAILKLVETPDAIHVRWTNSSIEVKEGATARASDAVANRETREMTINQPHFRGMASRERVFLVTHELLHFTDLDGKPLGDEGAVGPFAGAQGERHLVDSMAAASSVLQGAHPKEIPTYKVKLSRSQASKKFWVGFDFGASNADHDSDDNFAFNRYDRAQLNVRYQWTHWGVVAAYRSEYASQRILNAIDSKEELSTLGVGGTYRIFVASDPLTFWGQSHILLQLMVERIHAHYQFNDSRLGDEANQDVWGGSLSASYFMPLFWGFWGYVGTAYESHPYTYATENLSLNNRAGYLSGFLGVSYAF